jgi:hypothetical protein
MVTFLGVDNSELVSAPSKAETYHLLARQGEEQRPPKPSSLTQQVLISPALTELLSYVRIGATR